jgi:hypothetical protein
MCVRENLQQEKQRDQRERHRNRHDQSPVGTCSFSLPSARCLQNSSPSLRCLSEWLTYTRIFTQV